MVSDVIAWAFHERGIYSQIHYLDDFLFMASPQSGLAQKYLHLALATLYYLSFPVSGYGKPRSRAQGSLTGSCGKTRRTFLRKLFTLLHGTRAPHHFTCLSARAQADLAWWWYFLQRLNGSSFFSPATVGHCVHSDA